MSALVYAVQNYVLSIRLGAGHRVSWLYARWQYSMARRYSNWIALGEETDGP